MRWHPRKVGSNISGGFLRKKVEGNIALDYIVYGGGMGGYQTALGPSFIQIISNQVSGTTRNILHGILRLLLKGIGHAIETSELPLFTYTNILYIVVTGQTGLLILFMYTTVTDWVKYGTHLVTHSFKPASPKFKTASHIYFWSICVIYNCTCMHWYIQSLTSGNKPHRCAWTVVDTISQYRCY